SVSTGPAGGGLPVTITDHGRTVRQLQGEVTHWSSGVGLVPVGSWVGSCGSGSEGSSDGSSVGSGSGSVVWVVGGVVVGGVLGGLVAVGETDRGVESGRVTAGAGCGVGARGRPRAWRAAR